MKVIQTDLEERQIEALAKITIPGRISRAEWIRRFIDIGLSQPAIQEALNSQFPTKSYPLGATRTSAMLADNSSGAVGGNEEKPEANKGDV